MTRGLKLDRLTMFVLTFSTNNKATYTLLKGESRGKFSHAFSQQIRGQTLQRGLKYTPFARFVLFHSNIRLSINSLLFNQHWLYVNVSTNVSTERTASEKRFPKMKRGLAGMIYLSYICTRNSAKGELSSAGSERLPYKQRVGGSNPSAPTTETIQNRMVFYAGSIAQLV